MLLIEIPRIPPDGLDLDEGLDSLSLHLEGEAEFGFLPGGRLRCHIELAEGETVHVRGHLSAGLEPECGRCLERYRVAFEQELDLFYLPRPVQNVQEPEEEDVELSDRDVVVGYHDGQRLDLGEVVREQLFLALPLKRLCRPDCRGLCPSCGKNLNAGSCACPPPQQPEDPRLAPLRQMISRKS